MKYRDILIPTVMLAALSLLETMIGYQQSVDVRSWWPVALVIQVIVSATYTAVFVTIAGDQPIPLAYSFSLNGALVLVHLLLTCYFYFHEIDFLALNAGPKQLNTIERALRSPWTFIGIYLAFLVLHALIYRPWMVLRSR